MLHYTFCGFESGAVYRHARFFFGGFGCPKNMMVWKRHLFRNRAIWSIYAMSGVYWLDTRPRDWGPGCSGRTWVQFASQFLGWMYENTIEGSKIVRHSHTLSFFASPDSVKSLPILYSLIFFLVLEAFQLSRFLWEAPKSSWASQQCWRSLLTCDLFWDLELHPESCGQKKWGCGSLIFGENWYWLVVFFLHVFFLSKCKQIRQFILVDKLYKFEFSFFTQDAMESKELSMYQNEGSSSGSAKNHRSVMLQCRLWTYVNILQKCKQKHLRKDSTTGFKQRGLTA